MKLATIVLAATALCAGAAAQATVTVYTNQAAFLAAVSAPAVDTFEDFNITSSTPSPINRAVGPYAYTAAVSTTTFFGAGSNADHWLSTNTATDSITFTNLTGGVRGFGGLFFGSDIGGNFQLGDVTLSATDASGTVSQLLVNATTTTFLGFVTDGAFSSVVLSAVQPSTTTFLWPTANNLTLARAAAGPAVPEPATWALMIAGFAMTGAAMRRRKLIVAA